MLNRMTPHCMWCRTLTTSQIMLCMWSDWGWARALNPEKYRAARAATILRELIKSIAVRQRCREYGAQIDGARTRQP